MHWGALRQEDQKFKINVSYIVSSNPGGIRKILAPTTIQAAVLPVVQDNPLTTLPPINGILGEPLDLHHSPKSEAT